MIWSTPKTHQSRDVPFPRSLVDALVARLPARSQRMRSLAVRTESRSGSQIGDSECGSQQSPRPASPDLRLTTFDTPQHPWQSLLAPR
jgi:hypothetical protein